MSVTQSKHRTGGNGFTLIEMLVVIAVIAILAGMLLPVLGRSKSAAQKVMCVSNLGQWAKTFSIYVIDNEETTPRESATFGGVSLENWSQVYDPDHESVWYNALPRLAGQRPASDYFFSRDEFYDTKRLMHCPKARFPKFAEVDNWVFFSVAMNSKLINGSAITIPWSTVLRPDHTVLFLDNRLEDEPKVHPAQDGWDLGQPSAYASRFSARHRGSGNLAFGDGHAGSFEGRQVVDTRGTNPGRAIMPQADIIWTPDPGMSPNF